MKEDKKGICPNCETRGPVGVPCEERVCKRKGYHFVPYKWYKASLDFAMRKGQPLDPRLGQFIDRYLLSGVLGQGGMGMVYLALQRPLMREVAIKVISGMDMTPNTLGRFEREARALSLLDHPNVVRLYDYGIDPDYKMPYMVLEYVKHARTIRGALDRWKAEHNGQLSSDVVLNVFGQVLKALGAAHTRGIIHRDMKPDNVLITKIYDNPMFVKLLDFGLAKTMKRITDFNSQLTQANTLIGTPAYMAPEQVVSAPNMVVDARTDLYAVAVMLFEVFTGVKPFSGDTFVSVMRKKLNRKYDPFSLKEARENLTPQLKAFLKKGLQAVPGKRFANAKEMLDALQDAVAHGHINAKGFQASEVGSSQDRALTPTTTQSGEIKLSPLDTGLDKFGLPVGIKAITKPSSVKEVESVAAIGNYDPSIGTINRHIIKAAWFLAGVAIVLAISAVGYLLWGVITHSGNAQSAVKQTGPGRQEPVTLPKARIRSAVSIPLEGAHRGVDRIRPRPTRVFRKKRVRPIRKILPKPLSQPVEKQKNIIKKPKKKVWKPPI